MSFAKEVLQSILKHSSLLLMLVLSCFAMFPTFRFSFQDSAMFRLKENYPSETMVQDISSATTPEQANLANVSDTNNDQKIPQNEKCDLFSGDWIPYPSDPLYSNKTCDFIEDRQNCMKNGRPDSGYLHWRWKPRNCDLPRFDPHKFLGMMRNKSWALIGDSISRNHVQSLLCMLSTVERALEIYNDEQQLEIFSDEELKSKTWIFPSYNLTVFNIWSPYLMKATIFKNMSSEVELHLDKLDEKWTKQLHSWDYVIFSSGKWFLKSTIYYENNTIVGCHYCPKRNLTDVGFDFAYRKSLQNSFDFVSKSNHRGMIFFRTTTPMHFDRDWYAGGICNQTEPYREGEAEMTIGHKMLRDVELEEFGKAEKAALGNRLNIKLLDVSPVSILRPDAHPGPYRIFHPFDTDENAPVQNDCLHWCLPGAIDYWNDVLMEMLVNA